MVLMTLMRREAVNAKMSDLRLATSNLATLKTELMPRSAMASFFFIVGIGPEQSN